MDPVNQILDRINQTTVSSSVSKKISPAKSRKVLRTKSKQITLNVANASTPVTHKEDNFDEIWDRVEKCVKPILENQKSSLFETSFQDIQRICTKPDLLQQLNIKYTETIKNFTKSFVDKIVEISNENLLIESYKQIQSIIQILASLFSPFERAFLFPESTIFSTIQQSFISEFSTRKDDIPKVISCLACGFRNNREILFFGEKMKNFEIFEDLSNCAKFFNFEDLMLENLLNDSSIFFDNLETRASPDKEHKEQYLEWLKQQINNEQNVVKNLKQINSSRLIDNARKHLYGIKFSEDVMPVICYLFETEKFSSFVDLTNLCEYSESLLLFVNDQIKEYAQRKAKEAFSLDDDNCIRFLFKESKVFRKAREETKLPSMQGAIKGFSAVMNSAALKSEFLFAKFVDNSIRKEDFTDVDDYVDFFRELGRIDEFVEHNRQFLVNRLLDLGSQTFAKELTFVSKIQELVGPTDGVVNSTKMIEDAETSESLGYKPGIPGRIMLITYDAWPEYPDINIKIPDAIQEERTKFEEFFLRETKGKRIKWIDYLEDIEFTSECGVCGKCSLIHFCCLNEMLRGETPNVKPEIIDALKKSRLVDDNGNVTREKGEYVVDKLPLRIPETRQEEAEYEARRIRKQKILATTVRVVKKLESATKVNVFAEIRKEVPDATDEELDQTINEAAEKQYIEVGEDGNISYFE